MGDKLIQGKTLMLRDAIYIASLLVSCVVTYMTTAGKANEADERSKSNAIGIQENRAFGIARDKKIADNQTSAKEYARDYAYRKDSEIMKDVKKNSEAIHAIREEMVETRVKLSHIEKNQERTLLLLEQLINKK
jgi:hypothetical protein